MSQWLTCIREGTKFHFNIVASLPILSYPIPIHSPPDSRQRHIPTRGLCRIAIRTSVKIPDSSITRQKASEQKSRQTPRVFKRTCSGGEYPLYEEE